MMVVAFEVKHHFLDKDQKLHLTHESLVTLQAQMTKAEVHSGLHVSKSFLWGMK
jgi:hypothetical protein